MKRKKKKIKKKKSRKKEIIKPGTVQKTPFEAIKSSTALYKNFKLFFRIIIIN